MGMLNTAHAPANRSAAPLSQRDKEVLTIFINEGAVLESDHRAEHDLSGIGNEKLACHIGASSLSATGSGRSIKRPWCGDFVRSVRSSWEIRYGRQVHSRSLASAPDRGTLLRCRSRQAERSVSSLRRCPDR